MMKHAPSCLLETRVNDNGNIPLLAVCAGYELGVWRGDQLARNMMEWLPEFTLTWTEYQSISAHNAVERLRRAAALVYKTAKFQKRGEFGELLLHMIVRHVYGSVPAISKIFFKSARNDTIKGFDAVHVVGAPPEMELWFGEAKFYDKIGPAIRDVVAELAVHTTADYLRDEFMLITNHVDPNWPHAAALKALLDSKTSLDVVFRRTVIPVLLTYDSASVAAHTEVSEEFLAAFAEEVRRHHATFSGNALPKNVRIVLILLPLHTKAQLVQALDAQLRAWQSI